MNCSDTFRKFDLANTSNFLCKSSVVNFQSLSKLYQMKHTNIASTFYLAIAGVHREKYIAFVFFYTDIRIEFLEIHTINHICICALNILIDKNMLESKNTGN